MIRVYLLIVALFITGLAEASFKKVSITINGLTCSMCTYSVERAISQLGFVSNISMNLNTNEAEISFRNGFKPDIMKIVEKVYEAGFSVRETKVLYTFDTDSIPAKGHINHNNNVFYVLESVQDTLFGDVWMNILNKKCIPNKEFKKWKSRINALPSDKKEVYYISI